MQELFKLSLLLLLLFLFKILFFLITKTMLVHCGNLHKVNGIKRKAEFSRNMSFIPTALFFCPEWALPPSYLLT